MCDIFSRRCIERATYRDIAVRYLRADTHPDHDTIATFRREKIEAVAEYFVGVDRDGKGSETIEGRDGERGRHEGESQRQQGTRMRAMREPDKYISSLR